MQVSLGSAVTVACVVGLSWMTFGQAGITAEPPPQAPAQAANAAASTEKPGADAPTTAEMAAENPASEKTLPPETPPAKTVEMLAESARKSVVVISVAGRDGKQQGIGSGFVISPDGLIATNSHVISEGRPITVQFHDGREVPVVSIHATQRTADLAIIKVESKNLPALELGDSSLLKQGQSVVAIGNPHGLKLSIVSGVVSGTREIDGRSMIQVAMPIEPGNSGGPLLDLQGRVQGIITMKSLVTNNLGFAVMVNSLKPLLEKPNPVAMERWLTIGTLDPREWTPLFGARWRQRSGRILVDGLGQGFGGRSLCLSGVTPPELPYEVQVRVKLQDDSGAAGLVFCSDGGNLHYGFYPSEGRLRLSRFDGPDVFAWNVLQEKASPAYRKGDWNLIKVRLEKEKLICSVNDEVVIESTDARMRSGKLGLAKFRDTSAEFKGFQIGTELPRITPDQMEVSEIERIVADLPPRGPLAATLINDLTPHGSTAVSVLRQRAQQLELESQKLKQLAEAVHQQRVRTELARLLQGKEDEIDLFHAALLVAWLDNDEIDVANSRAQLERMAVQLKETIPADATPDMRRAALNKFLFEDNGFHGSRGDYYNKSNSYINEVLDDREGLPITLSVIYLELGRRIGLDMAGIGLPSHFVVEQQPPADPRVFIDVFEGGAALPRDAAEALVLKNTTRPLQDEELKPYTKKMIISRILQNLLGLARENEDATAMLRYIETLVELDPTAAQQRWLRAVFRFELGQLEGAKSDVDWLLETAPEGVDFSRVRELGRFIEMRRVESK